MPNSHILPLLVIGKEDHVFADETYNSRKKFNLLDSNGTNAITPLRNSLRTIAREFVTDLVSFRQNEHGETLI